MAEHKFRFISQINWQAKERSSGSGGEAAIDAPAAEGPAAAVREAANMEDRLDRLEKKVNSIEAELKTWTDWWHGGDEDAEEHQQAEPPSASEVSPASDASKVHPKRKNKAGGEHSKKRKL